MTTFPKNGSAVLISEKYEYLFARDDNRDVTGALLLLRNSNFYCVTSTYRGEEGEAR